MKNILVSLIVFQVIFLLYLLYSVVVNYNTWTLVLALVNAGVLELNVYSLRLARKHE